MKSRLWTLLVLVACLSLSTSDLPDSAISFDTPEVIVTMKESDGSVILSIDEISAASLEKALVRFVPLPDGATEPEIGMHGDGAFKEGLDITAGEPMIMRGLTLLPVRISAAPGTFPSKGKSPALEFEVRYRIDPGKKRSGAALAHSRGFFESFGSLLPDNALDKVASTEEGGYLILTTPDLLSSIEPLFLWKQQMGFTVTFITTGMAGTRNDEIAAYIKNLYETSEVPPQYLLIVGDVEQVPGFDYHQSVSDLPYSLVDGDDFLPDLDVGRLSVRNADEAATVIGKTVNYESNPYRAGGDDWFSRALVVGADYASSTPVTVSRWCREQLYNSEYTVVDSVFYPPHWTTGRIYIPLSINRGVSLVSYRGWAYGWRGWEPPSFTVNEIPSLTNGRMLPVVLSFVCLNGDFTEPECFGEAWIRAGTAEEPKGAVAFIGNSEHWSHTRHNDAAAIGAFTAFREEGVRRLAQIMNASKYHIFKEFYDQFYYDQHTDESVEFYFYIYSLLGDPSLEIRSTAPIDIEVTHLDSVSFGNNVIEVDVATASAKTALAGVRVGVVQNEILLGTGWTDETGRARVLYPESDKYNPVIITVTGNGVQPYQDSVAVYQTGSYLRNWATTVSGDDNADGIINPGETADLVLTMKNVGNVDATNVVVSLEALAGVTINEGSVTIPDIPAGHAEDATVSIRVDDDATDGLLAQFRVQAYAGANLSTGGFDLPIVAPLLRHESHELVGVTELAHGVETDLLITMKNEGSITARGPYSVLRCDTPELATVIDSFLTFGANLDPDSSIVIDGFSIEAMDDAGVGQAAVFTLETTTAEGYVSTTSFSIVVGTADHTAPLGPDDYGYYCYDNSDTDYPDAAPLYEWITTSAAYGGPGTKLDISDNSVVTVGLPFPFTFYGEEYSRIGICDNGWASFDTTNYDDFYNWSVPSVYGNGALIAPFWDNLDPDKEQDGVPVGDGIYTWSDTENNRFVIEWSRLGNLRSQHPDQVDYDDLQTFQIVLYDPDHYATPTGDGIIRFQYKQVVNNDTDRMYSSVGIENETGDVGLQYTYANSYPVEAAPLSAGLAVEFTTAAPVYSPFTIARFDASPTEEGIRLQWEPGDNRPRSSYRVYRAGENDNYKMVPGGLLAGDRREFIDTTAPLDGDWSYWIGSTDPVGRETVAGPFPHMGEENGAVRFALRATSSNPTKGATFLSYSLPAGSDVLLRVYSVNGRLVRTLVDGAAEAGSASVEWDGRDDRGERVPSGVYFARITAGTDKQSVKITLLK